MKLFPTAKQLRERLVAAALLTPPFFFLFLWGIFLSQSYYRIDLMAVLGQMLATAFVSAYCVTLFVLYLRASGSDKPERSSIPTEQ
jgi:hypothetical protein